MKYFHSGLKQIIDSICVHFAIQKLFCFDVYKNKKKDIDYVLTSLGATLKSIDSISRKAENIAFPG